MVVYSVELHLFQSSYLIELPEILRRLELEAFELWRTFESFMQINNSMPNKLREHFLQLECHIV